MHLKLLHRFSTQHLSIFLHNLYHAFAEQSLTSASLRESSEWQFFLLILEETFSELMIKVLSKHFSLISALPRNLSVILRLNMLCHFYPVLAMQFEPFIEKLEIFFSPFSTTLSFRLFLRNFDQPFYLDSFADFILRRWFFWDRLRLRIKSLCLIILVIDHLHLNLLALWLLFALQ